MLKHYILWDNSLLDLIFSFAIVVGGILVGKLLLFLITKISGFVFSKTKTQLDNIMLERVQAPLFFGIIIGSIWAAIIRLQIGDDFRTSIGLVYRILIVVNITWAISRVVSWFMQKYLNAYADRDDSKIDKSIVILIQRTVSNTIWIIGLVFALNNVGIEIGALLAGLGIGGVAIAFASQDTIKNFLGGITLFIDHPFRIGDIVKLGDITGEIYDIGLRSLRIKTYDERIVTLPNSVVVDSTIENISSEPTRRVRVTLGLTYNMPPEKIELAIKLLESMPKRFENDMTENMAAYFTEFGKFSINILFVYRIRKGRDNFLVQSNVNLEILRLFIENGIEIAFPTQTIYTKNVDK